VITVIGLDDHEDASTIVVSIENGYTGAMVYCTNHYGDKVVLSVDNRLLKQLCNQVAKAIKVKAQKTSICGTVKEKVL